jgi:esterase/lipase superfamily enzyme
MKYFKAYKARRLNTPTYFIESTAPDNVDDTENVDDPGQEIPPELRDELDYIEYSDDAVTAIAEVLASGTDPNLVVMVHGFNNPEPDVLRMYTGAAKAVNEDGAISQRNGLVCVGYRWPSEKMGTPFWASWRALPTLPTWLLYTGAAFVLASLLLFREVWEHARGWVEFWFSLFVHLLTLMGWILAGLILMAVLLRAIVYFRDNYRASNYGVNDLIQIIRAIDQEVVKQRRRLGRNEEPDQRVQLSFIGHSMGGFVVTNTIRTLSDVFKTPVEALSHYGVNAPPPAMHMKKIGTVFELRRFVLASPDIPAETLLSNRGNFLAAALSRFDEAFLFSNEGDEVLRQISTLANYFVFPTKSRNNGFRLGNVEILKSSYGLIKPGPGEFLNLLRIGNLTLQQLYDQLEKDEASRQKLDGKKPGQPRLPGVFTYFDCTDYAEPDSSGEKKGLLTFALRAKRTDPVAKLRWYSHLHLLCAYVFNDQKPNVHGGYFQGALSQQLIYRLACLGYDATVAAYGGEALLGSACEEKQIRMLLSPALAVQQAGQPIAAAAAAMTGTGGPARPT